jgi:hypothetical protein
MSDEIEGLHNKLVSQLKAPEYKFKMYLRDRAINFKIDTSIDTDHIEITDPISEILLNNCIRVGINVYDKKCYIERYNYQDGNSIFNYIERYLLDFLKDEMKQKNPRVTKLYKWMNHYLQRHNAPSGFLDEQLMLFKYLHANIRKPDGNVHIKNGIGILNALKLKYEKQGYELESRYGRRRRRGY